MRILFSLLVLSNLANASPFDKLVEVFNAAETPAMDALPVESAWAGKCVRRESPDTYVNALLDFFQGTPSSDPLFPGDGTFVTLISSNNPLTQDYYLNILKDKAFEIHRSLRSTLLYYSPLQTLESEDPFESGLKSTYTQKKENKIYGSNYYLKQTQGSSGEQVYIVKATCQFSNCGNGILQDDPSTMCYVWKRKF